MSQPGKPASSWLNPDACRVDDLHQVVQQPISLEQLAWASDLQQQVPIYDAIALRSRLQQDGSKRSELLSEWRWVWESGPGMVVIRSAFTDHEVLDATSAAFQQIIAAERGSGRGDHFAKPGANDRIWNALEKLCLHDPALFARYYANDMVAWAATAWLGPGYQLTSQVNVVNPGGAAQTPHRDYHLGFMTAEQAAAFPEQVHRLSPLLTLQGAIAQIDMPLESGPTLYLPHSQKYRDGYLVAQHPDFQAYFAEHHVQLPLHKGDAVFFNPALLHAAGHNRSRSIRRMANLLQISSAFGRAMEAMDRLTMSLALYPSLLEAQHSGQWQAAEIGYAIAACAEGYAFPTNLDRDPPLDGLAPPSQADLLQQALAEAWPLAQLQAALEQNVWRRQTH
ncbi:MAG: phytanoyl-CoA dioxygenase family protein [Thiolinea sp.]